MGKLQLCAGDIRKETSLVMSSSSSGSKAKVEEIARNAKNIWEEAKRVMQSLAMSGSGVGENHMRQLTLQKMEDNLKQAFQAVESAVIGFQTESERSRNKASAANKPSKGGE